jgi:uncharacterized integral membrane protein
MRRYFKLTFLILLLLVLIIIMVSIPLIMTIYIFLATENWPLGGRLLALVLLGGFMFLMTYGGLKKVFSKTNLFKKKKPPESKLP